MGLKCFIRHRMADNRVDDITHLMDMSGVSRNSINKLYRNENLQTIKIDTLVRLCDALGCKLSDLIEYIPEELNNSNKENGSN